MAFGSGSPAGRPTDRPDGGWGGEGLYEELWRACAGPLVEVPRQNERVFYFPQGHMEQLVPSTDQELDQQIPLFNLPSKILCRVVNIELRDMSQPTPTQELAAKDLHGFEWRFKHIFRGQPRRHLLTTGWSTFVTSKRLVAGDAFIFMRGENEELRVGVRRLVRQQNTIPSSVISSQSMHLGVLATASHAVSTHSLFTVFYKPRTSQFIVRVNKYLEAVKNGFAVGMRFKMGFEGEDVPEKRFTGTITGVGDISCQWASSKWRSLKVQWDEATNIQRPERVSPWDIEPFTAPMTALNVTQPVFMKNKRSRSPWDLSCFEVSSGFWYAGRTQSQEVGAPDAQTSETQVLLPQRPKESNDSNFMKSHSPHDTRLADCWLKDLQSPLKSSSSSMTDVSLKLFECAKGETKATNPSWPHLSSSLNEKPSLRLCNNMETRKKPEGSSTCRLFGIDLFNPSGGIEKAAVGRISFAGAASEDPLQVTASLEDSEQHSGLSKAPKEPMQVFPKEIQRIAVGRAVDLTNLEGYDDLILELERMFDIKGELRHRSKWEVVYTDDEGDMMLVGDDPWPYVFPNLVFFLVDWILLLLETLMLKWLVNLNAGREFCKMVKKISIYTSEEVKKMRPRSKFPVAPASEGEGGGGVTGAAVLEVSKIASIQN
ncbi:auxin response factor 11 [Cocos nucifera]|uniref:Auxin response factor n=1 Tax=Cocos nucifera TaxID=13894 RepID=A0A8K0NBX5_COCNU|nr:auxin response factor 11 [Cocos nucifera]